MSNLGKTKPSPNKKPSPKKKRFRKKYSSSSETAASAIISKESLNPDDILTMIEEAVREHFDWLARFHRVLICGGKASRDIISEQSRYLSRFGAWIDAHRGDQLIGQPVIQNLIQLHDQMRDDASFLAQKNAHGHPITTMEYDLLSGKITAFFALAHQVRDAFQHARSDLDPLTGLHNRQVMMIEIAREQERAIRSQTPCCLVLADIDHFKKINDTYGHTIGDRVLQAVALHLMAGCRPYDQVYRSGGEEFLLCLPNAALAEGRDIAERLRTTIAQSPVQIRTQSSAVKVNVTLSLGIVPIEEKVSLEKNIERADAALYDAKYRGRNRTSLWPDVKRAALAFAKKEAAKKPHHPPKTQPTAKTTIRQSSAPTETSGLKRKTPRAKTS